MEPDRGRFPVVLTIAFLALAGIGLARHEMWRDELQAWLIPVGSGSPAELIHNLRYEGHPALWHVLLWIVSRFTSRPEAMQVLHLTISAAAIFVFARYAPFPRLVRALFAFGYYPLYEYTVINRNYGLGMLLLFAACALLPTRRKTYLPLAGVLALLANANPYAWLIAAAFAGTLILEAVIDPELRRGDAVLGLLLFLAGAAVAVFQMVPPPDGGYASAWYLTWHWPRAFRVLATFARAWLPIPNPAEPNPWNSNLLFRLQNSATAAIALGLIAAAAVALRRSRTALLLYLSGTAALLGFTYLKYLGYSRHHGAHFLLLIACLWVARAKAPRRREALLSVFLGFHLVAGIWLYAADLRRPFSAAKDAARFLSAPQYRRMLVIGLPDMYTTPVAGYLGRPLFYAETRRLGTYVLWNEERAGRVGFREICRILRRQLRQHPEGVLMIVNQRGPICGARMQPEELASFQDSLLPDERFRVYRIQRR
ncbi:MAG TPA: hypothetical protein VE078_20550 [Thermoanaerobaculia bacterium]|nr:hypothetical protein [Thermoanaerobaculia bacterium]